MSLFPLPGRPSPRGHRRASRWSLALLPGILLCACAGTAPANPAAQPVLENGLELKREARGGERHSYPVFLEQGQFLRVVVDQNGVDAVVRLLDPDGAQVLAVDSPNGCHGDEDFAAVAQRSGLHRIEVSISNGEGGYALEVDGPRSPRERDRLRVEAVQATQEALAAEGKGDPEGQIARYGKALGLWKGIGERRRQAEMLYLLGSRHSDLRQPERSAELFAQAAALWGSLGDRGMGDPSLRAEALNEEGLRYQELARWKEAQARLEEALALATELGRLDLQSAVLLNLGQLARYRGDPQSGIDALQQSILLARQIGKTKTVALALNGLGSVYMDLSDRQQALRFYEEALDLCRKIGDRETESSVLNNLGDAYASLGEWEKALDFGEKALQVHPEDGDRTKKAIALNNIGVAYQRLGKTDKTLERFGEALALARKINDKGLEAWFLTNQAFLHLLRGEADEAQKDSRHALELAGDRVGIEAQARHALGSAYRLQGDHEAARQELERALARSRDHGNQSLEAEVILTLARLERDRGDLAAALSWVRQSVGIIESLRTRVVSQDLRASFLASKQAHYELTIDILMALHAAEPGKGHAAEAFRVSEQARARSLLEILQEGGTDLQLQGSSRRYAALTQRPLPVEEIQAQVLDGSALLLEYFLGEERSYLWAVTPTSVESFILPDRDRIEDVARQYYSLLTARNRPAAPGESPLQIEERRARRDAEAEQAAAELSGMVLGPIRHLLADQPLLVVLDGALQYIPFSALPVPATTKLLIQEHAVVYLPSASALAVLRREIRDRPAAPLTLAVLADPVFQKDDQRLERLQPPGKGEVSARSPAQGDAAFDLEQEREGEADLTRFFRLRYSGEEARAISSLLPPAQTFTAVGVDASRATALSGRLANYRNVHFATHGVIKSDHPELSSLVLSLYDEQGQPVDGFLRLNDIYNLELRADLVVLSACRTALGKEIRGEGLIGLTRGFMYAGAGRVLATLWSVNDLATANFMEHFYRAMLIRKLSPAAALREAQLAMLATRNRKSPYYWAGFSLQGEWK